MEPTNLSPEKVAELKGDLAALSKQHAEALHSAVYLGMNKKESDEYDQSRVRINELYGLLSKVAQISR